ncbi:hypothetical protein [Streptomyces sp. NPDC058623]|uniref:ApeA N-terminal domain 1-containing protein n=1 Tax=Streptomyces sp. NPDC058623 TaxID=3346563 RepID=UPI0036483DA0
MTARRSVNFGDLITGILIDEIDGTPYLAATLRLDENAGIRVEIPYIDSPGVRQFDATVQWFQSEQPPGNLLLTSLDGDVSLFDCRYAGHTVNYPRGIGLGKVMPSNVVLGRRDGDFHEPLKVKELRSQIDGLIEWTGFGAIERTHGTDDTGVVKKVTIEVAALSEISWRQGSAVMRLGGNWNLDPAPNRITVSENTSLISSFEDPQTIEVHLAEHRKVAALLSFIFGCAIFFRRHDVRDSRFNRKTLNRKVVEVPFFQLISRDTVKEHAKPRPVQGSLARPICEFGALSSKGLEEWARKYDDWSRFIHPAVSALNRPGAILENLVVNAAMSMEAAGGLIGPVVGEVAAPNGKPITATYMFRCLVESGWDWSDLCDSTVGLARAIANNYNTIKHFDRGHFPDPTETYLISSIASLVVRMLAIRAACPEESSIELFGARVHEFERLKSEFSANGLIVDGAGDFVTRTVL